MHADLDTRPSKNPFDSFPVVAYRVQSGTLIEDRFFVLEMDLPNDNLGPMAAPNPVTEPQARIRLAELGLTEAESEARINWARRWMATYIVKSNSDPALWLPPL